MRTILATGALIACLLLTGCPEEQEKSRLPIDCGYTVTFKYHGGSTKVNEYPDRQTAEDDRRRLIRSGYKPGPVIGHECTYM